MLKFIHLTDTHLVRPGQALYGSDPARRLAQAVHSIESEHADAAFVIITGDLAHWGEPEAYVQLRSELAALRRPVHLLIGNHDDRPNLRAAFAQLPLDAQGHVQYAFSAGGMRHIALDTHEAGVSHGLFCARRAAWLAEELARAGHEPVHLYMHHPPFGVGIPAMDRIALIDPGPLLETLARHAGRVRHLFFGHLHRPMAGSWRGIGFSSVRGTNHQVALRLDDTGRVAGCAEPPQYAVVLADGEGTRVHLHDFADRSERFPL